MISPDSPDLILAFDTSQSKMCIALMSGDSVLSQIEEPMARGQAERLLPLCQTMLKDQNATFGHVSTIGVGVGPGNFTGIRIAVSAARGLSLGLGAPAIGVTAFDALRLGTPGPCACAIPARRGHMYVEVFDGHTANPPLTLQEGQSIKHDGPMIGETGIAPKYPRAEAIARLAAARYSKNLAHERPKPYYLRPADAAPARDAPPQLLT